MAYKDTYMCDGINNNCLGEIDFNEVNWFTPGIGFCPVCWGRLHRASVPQKILDFCYDEVEGGDSEMADFVVGLTL